MDVSRVCVRLWYGGLMGLTPVRHIRVPDDLWVPARVKAAGEFRDVADVVRDALRGYVGAPACPAEGAALEGAGSPRIGGEAGPELVDLAGGGRVVPDAAPNLAEALRASLTCDHPKARRDPKNKNLCRACGTVVS